MTSTPHPIRPPRDRVDQSPLPNGEVLDLKDRSDDRLIGRSRLPCAAAFARAGFTATERRTHDLEIDLSGFVRGDYEARWRALEIAVRNNILTANEVREVEGWNPRPETKPAPSVV